MKKLIFIFCICIMLIACKDIDTNVKIVGGGDPSSGGNIPADFDWVDFWENYSGNTIIINPAVKHQEIKGFGAADAWVGAFVGRWWNEPVKQNISDLLFSQEFDDFGNPKGIGLSMWRVNLGAGSWEQGNSSGVGTSTWQEGRTTADDARRAESYLANIANAYDESRLGQAGIEKASSGIVYNWNKCEGHQYWMREAKKRGTEILVSASFAPVAAWSISGRGNMSSMNFPQESGNLTEAGYSSANGFPAYLADVADYFANPARNIIDNKGISQSLRFDYISPINEPQFWWGPTKQEGSSWYNPNISRLTRNIDEAIRDGKRTHINENNTKILIPEAVNWMVLYSDPGMSGVNHTNASDQLRYFWGSGEGNLNDVPSLARVAAGHTYWSHGTDSSMVSVRQATSAAAKALTPPVDVWNTEWCALGLGEGFEWGSPGWMDRATHWDVGIFMAKLMWADMIYGNMGSWSFWTAFDLELEYKGFFNLIGVSPGPGTYNAYSEGFMEQSGTVKSQPNMWTLGNYSLFIRPGFRRIDAGGGNIANINNTSGLMVSAYQSPEGYKDYITNQAVDRIVVVYVNWTNNDYKIAANFADGRNPKSVMCFVTKESNTNDINDRGNRGYGLRRAIFTDGGVHTVEKRSVFTVVYDF